MNKKQKKIFIRIIISAVLVVGLSVFTEQVKLNGWLELVLFLIP